MKKKNEQQRRRKQLRIQQMSANKQFLLSLINLLGFRFARSLARCSIHPTGCTTKISFPFKLQCKRSKFIAVCLPWPEQADVGWLSKYYARRWRKLFASFVYCLLSTPKYLCCRERKNSCIQYKDLPQRCEYALSSLQDPSCSYSCSPHFIICSVCVFFLVFASSSSSTSFFSIFLNFNRKE